MLQSHELANKKEQEKCLNVGRRNFWKIRMDFPIASGPHRHGDNLGKDRF